MFSLYSITLIYFYANAIHHKGDVTGAKFSASLMHSFFVLLLVLELLLFLDKFFIRSHSLFAAVFTQASFITLGVVLNLFNKIFFFGKDNRLKSIAEKRGMDLAEISWKPCAVLYFGGMLWLLFFGILVAGIGG